MRFLLAIALLSSAACKHAAPTTPVADGSGSAAPAKPKTPYATRRDAACEKLGPKQTSCAVEDLKASLAKGEISKKDFDLTMDPGILKKNTTESIAECEKITTTFQLRVVEVCLEKETECEPFTACLEHINDQQPAPAAK